MAPRDCTDVEEAFGKSVTDVVCTALAHPKVRPAFVIHVLCAAVASTSAEMAKPGQQQAAIEAVLQTLRNMMVEQTEGSYLKNVEPQGRA